MSDHFIIRYAGQGIVMRHGAPQLASDEQADKYPTEAAAWQAALHACMPALHTTVVDLSTEAKAETLKTGTLKS